MKYRIAATCLVLSVAGLVGGRGIHLVGDAVAIQAGARLGICQHGLVDDAPGFGWTLGHGQQLGIHCAAPGMIYKVDFFVEFVVAPGPVDVVILDDGLEVSRTPVLILAGGAYSVDIVDVAIGGGADILLCAFAGTHAVTGEDFTNSPFTDTYHSMVCAPGVIILDHNLVISATTEFDPAGVPSSGEGANPLASLPNPYTANAPIRFSTNVAGPMVADLYEVSGRRIRTLIDGNVRAGVTDASWDGRASSGEEARSGLYILRVETEGGIDTRKLILIR